MKKVAFLLGLLMLLGMSVQCTEDDDMDAQVAKVKQIESSGEEGDQDSDNDRD